jgi:hypothetical protein
MSRAYRLRVDETLRRVIKGSDRVTTRLEILAVVPPEEIAELLAAELAARGFEKQADGRWSREEQGVTITVDAATAEVEVKAEQERDLEISASRAGSYYDETNRRDQKALEERLRAEAQQDLERKAVEREKELERAATDALERRLRDLQPELDQVINRVTAEGLKRKASRLGQIKEVTEDPESGSLTIVVEV